MSEFSVSEAVRFGWNSFKERPLFFIGATIFIFFLNIAANWASGVIAVGDVGIFASIVASFLLSTLIGIGMTAFFLKAAADRMAVALADFWHPSSYWKYLGASILQMIVIIIGFILLIVPGIIFSLMFIFTPYIVVERSLTPLEAMKESARLTRGFKWKLFLFVIVSFVLNIIGALLLLVGLLVTIPLTMIALAHAYKVLASRDLPSVPSVAVPAPTA